jgi:transposase
MAAYSVDLRRKIVSAYERQLGSQRALADVFGVSLSFVEKVLRRYRATGELGPKPHGGGQKPHVDTAAQALIRQAVHAHPDATLEELCAWLADATGVRVSLATMCRVVQRLALPRKKNRSMRRSATRRASSRRGRTTAG